MSLAVPEDRTVIRTIVSLRLRLLANGLKRSPQGKAAFILGTVLGLGLALLTAIALSLLQGHTGAADAAVMLTAGLAIGWATLPLFLFSTDESSDPTRLTMLPLRPGPLMRGTLLASLIGPGPVVALVLMVGAAVAACGGAASVAVAVAAVPMTVVAFVVLSRAVAVGNARLLSSRRGKDFAVLGGLLFALLIQLGNLASQSVFGHRDAHGGLDLSPLKPFAAVLRWVPPVSSIDAIHSAADGSYLVALLQLALTAALLVVLLRWWRISLQQLMVTADASTQIAVKGVGRSRTAGLLPEGRVGAAMQRHLRYAWREPRAKAAVFTGIGMTVVFCLLSAVQGWTSVYLVATAGIMLGLQMVNLFGMDGSAFWMVASTLLTRADARDELLGRACAVLSYAVPVSLVIGTGLAFADNAWAGLAPALGLTFSLLGTGIGVGMVLSVVAPYAMPADSSPMRSAAPGQGGLVLLNGFGSMIGVLVLNLPFGGLLLLLVSGHGRPAWVGLPAGLAYGGALAAIGLRIAAPRLVARLPEILSTAVER